MVGLGEEWDEVVATLRDLRRSAARSSRSVSTCGRRSPTCRWSRYYTPAEFAELKRLGARDGLRPRRIGPARPQLLPCARADAVLRISARAERPWSRRTLPSFRPRFASRNASSTCDRVPASAAPIASASPPRRRPRTEPNATGAARCPASAIRRRACSSSAWRQRRTAPIAPAASSPATARSGQAIS